MSSFVIDKKEYVKVAGFIAGIAAGVSHGVREFWLYDHKAGKNTDKELFYKRFVQCYEMNAESVKRQYRDRKAEQDANEYKREFEQFFKKGKTIQCWSKREQEIAIKNVIQFLNSSLYQTEDEKFSFMMRHWYMSIIEQLTDKVLLSGIEVESWGSFEIESNDNLQIIA